MSRDDPTVPATLRRAARCRRFGALIATTTCTSAIGLLATFLVVGSRTAQEAWPWVVATWGGVAIGGAWALVLLRRDRTFVRRLTKVLHLVSIG
ncbi:MAG: hypothetical protein K8T90_00240 [Planctomycetes bacterium]|nr:hypothetical protein [Planctomycetota bacterium]